MSYAPTLVRRLCSADAVKKSHPSESRDYATADLRCVPFNGVKNSVDKVVEYVYDIDGLRVSKTVGGTKRTDYVFDLSGKILEEAGAEESVQYVFLKERHLARVEKGEVLFYGTDHLSSTILMTDSKGIPVWTADASPFGDFTVVSSDSYSNLGLKFTGKDADETTGLYYFNARWYDPELGRFITEDPIRDGENWYAYCSNNPVVYTDPSGNEILRYMDAYTMQDTAWNEDPVGHGTETMNDIGCAVTMVAKALNRLFNPVDFSTSPKNVNDNKTNFTGSLLDMSKAAADYGVSYDYWTTKTDLKAKLNELKQSDQSFALGAQVKYNAEGDTHFVSVNDFVTFDGKDYIEISPTSGSDSGKTMRPRDSWVLRDEKMYIELQDVVGIRQFSLEE